MGGQHEIERGTLLIEVDVYVCGWETHPSIVHMPVLPFLCASSRRVITNQPGPQNTLT